MSPGVHNTTHTLHILHKLVHTHTRRHAAHLFKSAHPPARRKNPELLEQLAQFLLAELMSMYQWTLNPHLRLRALGAIVKVLYHSSAASLKELLKNIPSTSLCLASLCACVCMWWVFALGAL